MINHKKTEYYLLVKSVCTYPIDSLLADSLIIIASHYQEKYPDCPDWVRMIAGGNLMHWDSVMALAKEEYHLEELQRLGYTCHRGTCAETVLRKINAEAYYDVLPELHL